jgi:hypothetical protein
MKPPIVKKAEDIIAEQIKKEVSNKMDEIAKSTKQVYDAFLKVGFNEAQAWEFAMEYTLEILMGGK